MVFFLSHDKNRCLFDVLPNLLTDAEMPFTNGCDHLPALLYDKKASR